jgi:hypothetical protein
LINRELSKEGKIRSGDFDSYSGILYSGIPRREYQKVKNYSGEQLAHEVEENRKVTLEFRDVPRRGVQKGYSSVQRRTKERSIKRLLWSTRAYHGKEYRKATPVYRGIPRRGVQKGHSAIQGHPTERGTERSLCYTGASHGEGYRKVTLL